MNEDTTISFTSLWARLFNHWNRAPVESKLIYVSSMSIALGLIVLSYRFPILTVGGYAVGVLVIGFLGSLIAQAARAAGDWFLKRFVAWSIALVFVGMLIMFFLGAFTDWVPRATAILDRIMGTVFEPVPIAPGPLEGVFDYSGKMVELTGEYVTSGRPLRIIAAKISANGATIRSFPREAVATAGKSGGNGGHGDPGSDGRGGTGGAGSSGDPGVNGSIGRSAKLIELTAQEFVGDLTVDNSGEGGGSGGNGGKGGNGGNGGSGKDGVKALVGCASGPGNGGDGGRAGSGGKAGDGGEGGDGGDVILNIDYMRSTDLLRVSARGGAGGAAGAPGPTGTPGNGGPRGSSPGMCSADGRGPGSSGAAGQDGNVGQPGSKGDDGRITAKVSGTAQIATGAWPASSQ